jgi:hypothetical protein
VRTKPGGVSRMRARMRFTRGSSASIETAG